VRLRRRAFCALAGAGLVLPRNARAADLAANCAAAIHSQMDLLPAGPVLLNSYLVESGGSAFDITQANAAYVYDNALAGLLLLAAGHENAARRIGQALAIAQAHDRKFSDGRLRNCYQAGLMTQPAKLAGFWDAKAKQWDEDPYQLGSFTGPIAWAMLLWAALGMQAPANAAGDFLNSQLRAPNGYYGGFYGFDPAQQKLTWQSTEQNIDLVAAFRRLGRTKDADHAAGFVRAAYDATDGVFKAGLAPNGGKNALLAADAGIWPYLAALGTKASALNAISALHHSGGIGFSSASQGVWLEGTAFAALALKLMGDKQADAFLATVTKNISPQGYVYATVAPVLSTGLTVGPSLKQGTPEQAFNYYRRPALSATAWAGLAALVVNPLSAS
jgi:hypothetical protein